MCSQNDGISASTSTKTCTTSECDTNIVTICDNITNLHTQNTEFRFVNWQKYCIPKMNNASMSSQKSQASTMKMIYMYIHTYIHSHSYTHLSDMQQQMHTSSNGNTDHKITRCTVLHTVLAWPVLVCAVASESSDWTASPQKNLWG